MKPTVSVIIPCFNLGAYLDEAVQSVIDQTYQDFEVVIVDDGSDDAATQHLLDSYRRPKTRIIRTRNQGLAAARNLGLEESTGNYLSFLDADDLLEPAFLERTVHLLELDDSLAFASCWLKAFGAAEFDWTPSSCDFPRLLAEDTVCTAALTTRAALVEVGGFDEAMPVAGYEDWDLAISLVERGRTGQIIPEFLFRYRQRRGSMTATCTTPANHARLFEFIVDKHREAYRRFQHGVLTEIEGRIVELETARPAARPARPIAANGGDGWRQRILDLENYRRDLEESIEASRAAHHDGSPPAEIEWGSLRRLEPVSRTWGLDRGHPVDRYYIERFLQRNADAIAGDVLEVKDSGYATRFGTLARSLSVVDIAEQNSQATIVADLSAVDALPEMRWDCFVLTQTMHIIYEVDEVVRNVHRALVQGGVCLATLPCVSRVDYESGVDGDFWRFTAASARRLFEAVFGEGNVEVVAYGNVLACTAFLQGLASTELSQDELDEHDPYFPLLLGVRAVKPGTRDDSMRGLEGRIDGATCGSIFGWAWDPTAPEQRLRLDVWEGERLLGTTTADNFRHDLKEARKADGRVAFVFTPTEKIHRDSPIEIHVTLANSETMLDAPRTVECVCDLDRESGPANPVVGFAVDAPRPGTELSVPSLEVAGWALGRDGPVEAIELLHRGVVFRRVPVDAARPDLTRAFPAVPWAGHAGFKTRISLAGVGGPVELELVAVLPGGERIHVDSISGDAKTNSAPASVVVLLDAGRSCSDDVWPIRHLSAATRVLVRNSPEPIGHPAFEAADGWNRAIDAPADFVWLGEGLEGVSEEFLSRAVQQLAENPDAAFAAVGAEELTPPADHRLSSVLSGTALGATVVFRGDAARALGGFDESTTSVAAAQWDLCIRAVGAGRGWVGVADVMDIDAASLAERSDDDATRWLYRKHATLYEQHLRDVLLDREMVISRLLRKNHVAERLIGSELRPLASARRRERDRLGAKARRLRAGNPGRESSSVDWGDYRRMEPVSPFWGSERGLTVDRYYIERFLERHADDIRGAVLEVHDSVYAHRYGNRQLDWCDVIDVDATNPSATIIADLQTAAGIATPVYDCLILTHFLQLIPEIEALLRECNRILKPEGALLVTAPCVSRIDPDSGLDGDFWRFTESTLRRLLEKSFSAADVVDVRPEGNRVATAAFLMGLEAGEVERAALDRVDVSAPLLLTARTVKGTEDVRR